MINFILLRQNRIKKMSLTTIENKVNINFSKIEYKSFNKAKITIQFRNIFRFLFIKFSNSKKEK